MSRVPALGSWLVSSSGGLGDASGVQVSYDVFPAKFELHGVVIHPQPQPVVVNRAARAWS